MRQLIRAFFLVVVVILVAAGAQSQDTKQPSTREQLVAAAREVMISARYCALITLDSSRHPQARTLDPFPPGEDLVVWLGTNPRSRKVAAIRRNPHVTLYYFDREAQAYVTISGFARLVNDPKLKMKWWKDEWLAFYHDRAKDYLLIRVTPEKLEVVNVKKGIIGDSRTWKPPSVSFSRRNWDN